MRHIVSIAIAFAGALAVPSIAWADIPPADACTAAGASCDNAGANYDEPGTCQAARCQRTTPSGSTTYDCTKCVASSGSGGSNSGAGGAQSAAGGAHSAAGGGQSAAGAPTSTEDAAADHDSTDDEDGAEGDGKSKDDGGCAVAARPASSGVGRALLALGLGALLFRRRR